jgi:sec-independent protein translocase protein TatA
MGSFSIFHWLIVLLIVVLVFGTKKLPSLGKDLGSAVRGFKEGVKSEQDAVEVTQEKTSGVIAGESDKP